MPQADASVRHRSRGPGGNVRISRAESVFDWRQSDELLVEQKLAALLDMRLDKSIARDEDDKKARELKEKQVEIATRMDAHQQGHGDYRTTLESLISLAARAAELFERSKTEEKRQLLAFVFSNLKLGGKS